MRDITDSKAGEVIGQRSIQKMLNEFFSADELKIPTQKDLIITLLLDDVACDG
jgi:hypothetical protein